MSNTHVSMYAFHVVRTRSEQACSYMIEKAAMEKPHRGTDESLRESERVKRLRGATISRLIVDY